MNCSYLALYTTVCHGLKRNDDRLRKKYQLNGYEVLGVPQSSPTFVGKERVTKLEGRLHRRLCLRRLNFKTHFLRVRRANIGRMRVVTVFVKKKIPNSRQSGIKPHPFQTQTYGSSLFPISGHKTQTDKRSKTTPFGPEPPHPPPPPLARFLCMCEGTK